MSPRAACRLETLAFSQVYDYMPGKVDWLARHLPVEGTDAGAPLIGRYLRHEVVTAAPDVPIADVRTCVAASPHSFALVTTTDRVLLGRLRGTHLDHADANAVTARDGSRPLYASPARARGRGAGAPRRQGPYLRDHDRPGWPAPRHGPSRRPDVDHGRSGGVPMTAGAGPERASSPACWCCGGEREEAELVRLGGHPEVGICLDCAVWVKRRAAARRHEQHPSFPGHLHSGLDTIRNAVIARGWHERGALGMFLRRVDRWLP